MPTIAQNASLRNSSEYITAETKAKKKATAAGKPLEKKPTLLKSEMNVIEKTSKYKVSKGAEQLATFLRNFHKV